VGCTLVVYFSEGLKALSTVDFWIGDIGIFLQGTLLIYIFNLSFGTERGWTEAHHGAELRIPKVFKFVIRWLSPAFLTIVFALFVLKNVAGWNLSFSAPTFLPTEPILDLVGGPGHPASGVARLTVFFLLLFAGFTALMIRRAGQRWDAR
jgi:glycerol uptake facilitator-like aquaporin